MEAAELTATRTPVAMVWPEQAVVRHGVLDVRGEPHDDAELVDQLHSGDIVTILGANGDRHYVQGADHYFGWVRGLEPFRITSELRVVSVTLADVRDAPAPDGTVIDRLPAGSVLPITPDHHDGWLFVQRVGPRSPARWVAFSDTAAVRDLPHRPPTADDLLATAEAFLGVPYLWGGTSAHGMDCSGFAQQVYRLNGVRLDRDADQQAVEGRAVDVPRPGDLVFFGAERVAHVALATGERTFLHAPQTGAFVERGELSPQRTVRAIRRYLPELG